MGRDSTHVWLPLDEAWAEVIFAAFHDPAISATLPVKNEARVAFHLHALQPFEVKGQSIRLGKLEIAVGWAESITQREELTNHEFVPVYHLVLLSRSVKAYSLQTAFHLR